MDFLKSQGKASRTEIVRNCFRSHVTSDKLDRAIDELLTASPPVIEVETVKRGNGGSGVPTKFYNLIANFANSANYEHSCGLQPDSSPSRTMRTLRTNDLDLAQLAQVADLAIPTNQPQSRTDIDSSLNSHVSHDNDEDAEVF